MKTITAPHSNVLAILRLVSLSSLFLFSCTNQQTQSSLPATTDNVQKHLSPSPYLILGNADTIYLDGNPPATVLATVDGWRLLMIDTNEVAIIQLSSKLPTTSSLLTRSCQLTTPPNRKMRLDITEFLRAELQSNSTLHFTPVRANHNAQPNPLQLDGSAILHILGSYRLNSNSYSLTGTNQSTLIISDAKGQDSHYLKNIGFRPVTITKPRHYNLPNQHELNQTGKDEPLQGEDLETISKRFPEVDPYFQYNQTPYSDVIEQFIKWYGLKGFKLTGGMQKKDLQVRVTGCIGRLIAFNTLFDGLDPGNLYFGLEHDSLLISKQPLNLTPANEFIPNPPNAP